MTDQLLTLRQVADRLACSYDHAYDLVTTKTLKAVDLRGKGSSTAVWRVRESDLAKFIDGRAA